MPAAAASSEDVSHDIKPDTSPYITPESQNSPIVIQDGKITINSGGNDEMEQYIAEVIANLTEEEKQNITVLEINSEVSSLGWLSELVNLEQLTLNRNASAEELDISGNTSLKELNVQGANVKSLNVEGCENLVSLDCSSCGLESINLAGCTSLSVINIRENGLMRFDAGMLPSLQELICDSQAVYVQTIGTTFAFGEYFDAASFVKSASAEDNIKNLKAFDGAGNEIASEFDAETGTASFAAAPSMITYDYDTSFEGVMMDVTVYATEAGREYAGILGSPKGGCNSFMGIMAMSAVLLLLMKKR